MQQRKCFIVDETMAVEGGYRPGAVIEGVPGFTPLDGWVWGPSIGEAKTQCADANEQLGLAPEDVHAIRISSMVESRPVVSDVDAVDHDPRVEVWADSFGVFHVRVPRHAVFPIGAARRALREELTARHSQVAREVWMHPERVHWFDTEHSIVYRQRAMDGGAPS